MDFRFFQIGSLLLPALLSSSVFLFNAVASASHPVPAFTQVRHELPAESWRVQPATSPGVVPDEGDWGRVTAFDPLRQGWRHRSFPISDEVTSWSKIDRAKVDSLWYETRFATPAGWTEGTGKRVFLEFGGFNGDLIVFLNGRRVGEVLTPAGGEVEITEALLPAGSDGGSAQPNVLRVFNTRNYTGVSRGADSDLLRTAAREGGGRSPLAEDDRPLGLLAPVSLILRPELAVTDVLTIPSWREKKLSLEICLDSSRAMQGVSIVADVFDEQDRRVLTLASDSPLSVPVGQSVQRIVGDWAEPVLWDVEKPYLYRVAVRLERDGKNVDYFDPVTFGFREIWTEGRQLMLNGHPLRLRLTDIYGANANALSFYRLMGFNAGEIQPHPNLWWREWHDSPLFDRELLNEADRLGFVIIMPAPSIAFLGGDQLLREKDLQQAYTEAVRAHVRRYGNHPSVLVWAIGMNTYNPRDNIHAATMGQREIDPKLEKPRVLEKVFSLVREVDQNRLVFSHADGSLGDISSANVYLNLAPLQEREEWPMEWAKSGDMPYIAVEFGLPYEANFWKGKQFLLTEYLAMYLGESAYEQETEQGLSGTVRLGLANTRKHGANLHFNDLGVGIGDFPAYWQFVELFVTQTNRTWRTWGVTGWLPWNLNGGYGDPPSLVSVARPRFMERYRNLPEKVTQKPDWVNPSFDIQSQSNQPFLAWIAGGADTGAFTDKTHAYFSAETFEKQIALVWDGAESKSIEIHWAVKIAEKTMSQGSVSKILSPGEIAFVPLELQAPQTDTRLEAVLSIQVIQNGMEIATDSFPFQIFPAMGTPAPVKAKIAVYDPVGKSAPWLKALGVVASTWKPGDSLDGLDVLFIGREALKLGDTLPYGPSDIARGLRVVVLEQKPAVWEALGFESIETLPRYVFAADRGSSLLADLEPEDLINWRGSPDLLPEGRQVRTYDTARAPRWTNRHAVASVALKVPEVVGFTPILRTEFDLGWSPLLEWRYGHGRIIFSTLDLTDRIGVDPAASQLAANLMRFVENAPTAETRRVFYQGDAQGAELLQCLQVKFDEGDFSGASNALLVLDESTAPGLALESFLENGNTVFFLPRSESQLNADGFVCEQRKLYRVKQEETTDSPVMRAIGPNLLRWRDSLDLTLFADQGQPAGVEVLAGGILMERRRGSGLEVALQVSPDMLRNRYENDPGEKEAIQLSVSSLHQLTAQILTNLGASPSPALAERVCHIGNLSVWQPIGSWNVLGPYRTDDNDAKKQLAKEWPGEADAIAGDDNPNTLYPGPSGPLDWRSVIQAGERGFIDLGQNLGGGENALVYAQRRIESDKNRIVRMRFGVDYALKVWVNGKVILTVDEAHGAPEPGAFLVDVPLRKGENVIAVKALPGSKGFGFWAEMSFDTAALTSSASEADTAAAGYYQSLFYPFDPYQFFYW